MKKILVILLLLFLFQGHSLADWHKISDGAYFDNQKVKTKGNYLYLKLKYDNIQALNSDLKKYSPGILLDGSIFSFMTQDLIIDCKNPRYKISLTLMYGKNGQVINKIKDNTWEYDLTKANWGTYCEAYDYLKNLGL